MSESQISLIHIAVKYYRSVLKEAEQVRRAMEKEKVRGVSEDVEKTQSEVEGEEKTRGESEESEQTQDEKGETQQTQNEAKQTRIVSQTMKGLWQMYSLERAAAYNLCLILQNSGANAMAMEIRQRYLVVE